MNASLRQMLPAIERWPAEDQQALAEFAREIEAARTGVYVMTPEEEAAVAEGLAQADRGEFVSDEQMAAVWKRFAAK
jgi:predicted transcriptional regulator